jgi:hypothetical protein
VLTGLIALALIPFAAEVDSLAALITVAALMTVLAAYEALHFRARRSEIRAAHA